MAQPINPYVAGAALRDARGFFGRQDILDWVAHELRRPATNALVLIGQRRIGKTSFLLQLRRCLPTDAFLPIYFDLQDQASYPLGQVLADLADTVAECANLSTPAPSAFDDQGHVFQRAFLPQVHNALGELRRPVFLLDEFDVLDQVAEAKLPETAAAKTLFPFLRRVMADDLHPAFVFVVGRRTDDLSLDFTSTFRTSLVKEIRVLDEEDAKNLVRQAEANNTLRFTDQAVVHILSLTNNHPYLTQLLCQRIWERAYTTKPATPPLIDISEVEVTVPDALEVGDQALVWLWNGLSSAEKIYAAAMAETTTEGEITTEDHVIKVLTASAARLHTREVELAPRDLVKRRVLEGTRGQGYHFTVQLFHRWVRLHEPLQDVKDELDRIEPMANRLYNEGQDLLKQNQWEDAISYFRDALQANPRHFRARLNLGEALLEISQIDGAIVELTRAYELDREEARLPVARALVSRAKVREKAGDEEGALADCQYALQVSPGEQEAQEVRAAIWMRRGDVALERGDLDAALAAYQQAGAELKIVEVEKRIWVQRGDAALERDDLDAALAAYRQADAEIKIIEVEKRIQIRQGDAALERGDLDAALAAYRQADAESKIIEVQKRIRIRQGDAALERGDLDAALAAYQDAGAELRVVEVEKRIWIRLGDSALGRGDLGTALAAYQQAGAEQKIAEVEIRKRRQTQEDQEREAQSYERAERWDIAAKIYQQLRDETADEGLRAKWEAALRRVEDQLKAKSSRAEPGSWPPGFNLDGRYEIVVQLATTERCEIYSAKELQPPKDAVVVKRLKRDKLNDDDARGRFEREVAVLRHIRHQSVLSIYDTKTTGENRYFVTEFADKGSLRDYLETRPNHKLRPIEALEIAMSICQGLDTVHRRDIIHRDVKPGNILLFSQRDGSIVAKLADFSIARVPEDWGEKSLTQTDWIPCTPPYASPEQLDNKVVDARSDLYSWAIVFFEMLTGEHPTESLKDPATYDPMSDEFSLSFFSEKGVPHELAGVLQKALHIDRNLRYQSAGEIREALESVKALVTEDINRYLSAGEEYTRALEWQSASVEFKRGLELCEWYGDLNELRGEVGELAQKLRVGHLYAQGMIYLAQRQWQAAVDALEPLRTLAPNYLGIDIAAQLRLAQSEQQFERIYQRILKSREQGDWTEILRLATELTTSYKDRSGSESIGDIRKLALYARGKKFLEEEDLKSAYDQFHRLYRVDPDYENVAELCATAALRNAMREDIPLSWAHQVEWLEKAVEIDPNHREGRTQAQLDRARHRWAEELLDERE